MLLNAVKRKNTKHSFQIEMIFLGVLKLVNLLVWELPVNENKNKKLSQQYQQAFVIYCSSERLLFHKNSAKKFTQV